jgi:hypothetical protein
MKAKKVTFVLLFGILIGIVLIGVVWLQTTYHHHPLSIALNLNQDSYLPNNQIRATLRLQNVGSVPVLINRRMGVKLYDVEGPGEVWFIITSTTGAEAQWSAQSVRINRGLPEDYDFSELAPGEVIELTYILNNYYALEVGEYKIKAIYHNQYDPRNGQVAWKGKLESNIVTFTIKP